MLFKNEIINMKKMKNGENENIVKLIEDYEKEGEIGIIMELCDDNLLNIACNKKDSFNSKQIRDILNQLNKSFKVMNEQKIVHRALNLENILIKYKDEENDLDYDYLMTMNIWSLTPEKINELDNLISKERNEYETLNKNSPSDLWKEDLEKFIIEYDKIINEIEGKNSEAENKIKNNERQRNKRKFIYK